MTLLPWKGRRCFLQTGLSGLLGLVLTAFVSPVSSETSARGPVGIGGNDRRLHRALRRYGGEFGPAPGREEAGHGRV